MIGDLQRISVVRLLIAILLVISFATLWLDHWFFGLTGDHHFDLHRMYILCFLAAGYGGLRVAVFHPALNRGYGRWLSSTSWTAGKPFPLGEVELCREDALVVGGLLLLAGVNSLVLFSTLGMARMLAITLVSFAVPYLGLLCVGSVASGRQVPVYLYAFAFPLFFFPSLQPYGVVAVAVVVYGIWWVDFRSLLDGGTWVDPDRDETMPEVIRTLSASLKEQGGMVWWPYRELMTPRPHRIQDLSVAVLHSVLPVWWWFAGSRLSQLPPVDEIYFLPLLLVVGLRLGVYTSQYRPPISLGGRVAIGRLIIPAYDRVFLAPVLMLAVGIALPYLLSAWVPNMPLMAELCLCLVLLMSFTLPPTFYDWQLVGASRLVPGKVPVQNRLRDR